MPNSSLVKGLVETAEILLAANDDNPSQENLRRAVSTSYYAIFHTICVNCADCIVGRDDENTPEHAWRRAYRALRHDFSKNACFTDKGKPKEVLGFFPEAIQDFANTFYSMQIKRHKADYDPSYTVDKSEVNIDLKTAKQVIEDFEAVELKHRKAFATLVLFQDRKQ